MMGLVPLKEETPDSLLSFPLSSQWAPAQTSQMSTQQDGSHR